MKKDFKEVRLQTILARYERDVLITNIVFNKTCHEVWHQILVQIDSQMSRSIVNELYKSSQKNVF
jgi:hypothetical protein